MKKFTALAAAVILAVTLSVPVFAEPEETISSAAESSVQASQIESTVQNSETGSSVQKSEIESSVQASQTESSVVKAPVYKSYAVAEAGMYISLPDDMYVLTRNIESKSSLLKIFRMTKEELLENFSETDTYIKASAKDFSYDVTVNVLKNENTKTIGNLSSLDEPDIQNIVKDVLKQPVYTGCSRSEYNNSPYLSFPMDYESEETRVRGMQEYTIVKGARIIITFQFYMEQSDDTMQSVIADTMNTIVFDGIDPSPDVSKAGSSSVWSMDVRYLYLILSSVLAILFLTLMIVTALKHKKAKSPRPAIEEAEPPKLETKEEEPEAVQETESPAEEKPTAEPPAKEEEEEELPVVESQLEIVEIAFRIIPALTKENEDPTEIQSFIQKKMADMEFFAAHPPQNYSNANAFYQVNAESNLPSAPMETIDDAIRNETLQTVAGDSQPETLTFEEPAQEAVQEQDSTVEEPSNIQLAIGKKEDGSLTIAATEGQKALDVEIEESPKTK